MTSNLHILADDKFTDDFIDLLESIGGVGVNHYVVRTPPPYRYIKHDLPGAFIGTREFDGMCVNVPGKPRLIVHYLSDDLCRWIMRHDEITDIAWIFWGGDLYEGIPFKQYDALTRRILLENGVKCVNRGWYAHFWGEREQRWVRRAVLKRIRYLCHYNEIEIELVKRYLGGNFEKIYFFYPQRLQINDLIQRGLAGTNRDDALRVIVGNSRVAANNHPWGLHALKLAGDMSLEVMLPMTYGPDAVGVAVAKYAEFLFPGKTHILRDHMPFENYMALLQSASVGVFPALRGMGLGNIVTLLCLGKTVYVPRQSPTYGFLSGHCPTVRPLAGLGMLVDDVLKMDYDKIKASHEGIRLLFNESRRDRELRRMLGREWR